MTTPETPRRGARRIAVTGGAGFLGTALLGAFRSLGDHVTRLVRRAPRSGNEVRWDPELGVDDPARLEGLDVVVHLAGEPIARRWNARVKMDLWTSRVPATRVLAEQLARLDRPPGVFVSSSAVGIYGDRGEELLTETSPPGEGMLARLAVAWEEACAPLAVTHTRVVQARTGLVLGREGGALGRMLLPFSLGLGGPLGSGLMWWSWIALEDWVAAMDQITRDDSLIGPVNVVAPFPVTNAHFAYALGSALKRPVLLPVPPFALRLVFGEMADEVLLASQRVLPARLRTAGYRFAYPRLEGALRAIVSGRHR